MKKETVKMFHDLLLVRRLKPEEKTAGGIIIPEESKDESRYLEVLGVGSKVRGINVGDTIVTIGQNPGGQELTLNGEPLTIMREKYVFGVVEK